MLLIFEGVSLFLTGTKKVYFGPLHIFTEGGLLYIVTFVIEQFILFPRLKGLNMAGQLDKKPRKRSNSMPIPKIEVHKISLVHLRIFCRLFKPRNMVHHRRQLQSRMIIILKGGL